MAELELLKYLRSLCPFLVPEQLQRPAAPRVPWLILTALPEAQEGTTQVWLPCAAPENTGFRVLGQWSSLFAIQINIMSLITFFIKSMCHGMRLGSHKSQPLQTSFLTATPDPAPSPVGYVHGDRQR